LVVDAVDGYRDYVDANVQETIDLTTVFTDAVRAGDVEAAKAAFAPSRQGWERIEPVAALIEEIDGAVDARVDDFESETDPAWTGWHRIEYILWEENTTEGADEFADQLDEDLQTLQEELPDVDITGLAMARGASELIEEVSSGKITGEEDRYSHTDFWDFAANVEGSREVIDLLTPALQEADSELVNQLDDEFDAVEEDLEPYQTPDGGYVSFTELTKQDKQQMKADLAVLSETLAQVPGVLGLE
jgi:iron uptake system component EfeO